MKYLVLVVLLLGGCSSIGQIRELNSGCDLVCKSCAEIQLKCNQDIGINETVETKGTISGPSLK